MRNKKAKDNTNTQPISTPDVLGNTPTIKKKKIPKSSVPTKSNKVTPASPKGISQYTKCTSYHITFEDGSVQYATGRHAEVLFNYIAACEQHCSTYGLMRYIGDPLPMYTATEWAKFKEENEVL